MTPTPILGYVIKIITVEADRRLRLTVIENLSVVSGIGVGVDKVRDIANIIK